MAISGSPIVNIYKHVPAKNLYLSCLLNSGLADVTIEPESPALVPYTSTHMLTLVYLSREVQWTTPHPAKGLAVPLNAACWGEPSNRCIVVSLVQ